MYDDDDSYETHREEDQQHTSRRCRRPEASSCSSSSSARGKETKNSAVPPAPNSSRPRPPASARQQQQRASSSSSSRRKENNAAAADVKVSGERIEHLRNVQRDRQPRTLPLAFPDGAGNGGPFLHASGQPRPKDTDNEADMHAMLLEWLENVEKTMKGPGPAGETPFGLARRLFQLDEFAVVGHVDDAYQKMITELNEVQRACVQHRLLKEHPRYDSPEASECRMRLGRIRFMFSTVYMMLKFAYQVDACRENVANGADIGSQMVMDMWRTTPVDWGRLSAFQALVQFILFRAQLDGLRLKNNSMLYRPKVVPFRVETDPPGTMRYTASSAYEKYMSLRRYIKLICDRETRNDMWKNLWDSGTRMLEQLLKYFDSGDEEAIDPELPKLRTDRTVTAWRNGVYYAMIPYFHRYTDGPLPCPETVACKYFDCDFDDKQYADLLDIDHPFMRILEYQEYTDEEKVFFAAMLGRLIFEPGALKGKAIDRKTGEEVMMPENWEVIGYLLGDAGTGKSSILAMAESLHDTSDIQPFSNEMEKVFGLQAFVGKRMFIGYDIKKKFGLSAANVQTMASYEYMSIPVKNQPAFPYRWDVPGFFAGNELPAGWRDKHESMVRRLLIFDFDKPVPNDQRDNSIKVELQQKHGSFYRLVVLAYHYWVKKAGAKNIWAEAPERFRVNQGRVRKEGNLFEEYLDDRDYVQIDVSKSDVWYVPLQESFGVNGGSLIGSFNRWCEKRNVLRKPTMKDDDLRKTLKRLGVNVRTGTKIWPPESKENRTKLSATFCYGIRVSDTPFSADEDGDAASSSMADDRTVGEERKQAAGGGSRGYVGLEGVQVEDMVQ